uniref:Uncharacterized protein n=1 Tax=Oryza rufipogon TaxID=4529 RepID=A0A0E0MVL9_ORYRU
MVMNGVGGKQTGSRRRKTAGLRGGRRRVWRMVFAAGSTALYIVVDQLDATSSTTGTWYGVAIPAAEEDDRLLTTLQLSLTSPWLPVSTSMLPILTMAATNFSFHSVSFAAKLLADAPSVAFTRSWLSEKKSPSVAGVLTSIAVVAVADAFDGHSALSSAAYPGLSPLGVISQQADERREIIRSRSVREEIVSCTAQEETEHPGGVSMSISLLTLEGDICMYGGNKMSCRCYPASGSEARSSAFASTTTDHRSPATGIN